MNVGRGRRAGEWRRLRRAWRCVCNALFARCVINLGFKSNCLTASRCYYTTPSWRPSACACCGIPAYPLRTTCLSSAAVALRCNPLRYTPSAWPFPAARLTVSLCQLCLGRLGRRTRRTFYRLLCFAAERKTRTTSGVFSGFSPCLLSLAVRPGNHRIMQRVAWLRCRACYAGRPQHATSPVVT